MNKNRQADWRGRFISADFAKVTSEPAFSLADMFSGKVAPQKPIEERLKPVSKYSRQLILTKSLKQAKLTITAHGVYQAYINGKNVSEAVLAPDFTSYNHLLYYQELEVTDFLREGENVLEVYVGDGWYAGRISVQGGSGQFGKQTALLADLDLTYQDGSQEIIGTDERFTVSQSFIQYSDIQIGEKQDLRLLNQAPAPTVVTAKVITADYSILARQEGPQVKRQERLAPQKIWSEGSSLVVDFGQVIAGRVKLTATLAEGQEVILEHAEVLNEAGQFFQNIVGRNKDQRDIVIGRGQVDTFEPLFTFHGFRYVRITGLKWLESNQIEAIVLYSDMEKTGAVNVSEPTIQRLLDNIKWSQKGNMISIPTDCPQRERMGWTGDMQVFSPASTFYYNTDSLISRWLKSVRADQQSNGEILDYSPAPKDFFNNTDFTGSLSSAGWGDAIIMVPWTLYERYGDTKVLADNFEAMVKWHQYARQSAKGNKTGQDQYIWDTKFNYGDWMFPSFMLEESDPMRTSQVTRDLVGTAFLAHSSELLGQVAKVLGKDDQVYSAYADKVKEAFQEFFLTTDGYLKNDYQGCYVLALAFKMVPKEKEKTLVNRLMQLIHENGDCLDTGFLSVPYLLDVLCDHGQVDMAKKLFLQDKCPSWLYEVKKGATTIWESWACINPAGQVGSFSFNHYAMGCVLDWFIRRVCGLRPAKPGYAVIEFNPDVDLGIDFNLTYQTPYGEVKITKAGVNFEIVADEAIQIN